MAKPLKVAWFTYFPVEWLENLPAELRDLPRMHPATWQRVLLEELQKVPDLELHIVVLRKQFPRTLSFQQGNATFHCIRTPAGGRASTLFWLDTWQVGRVLRRIRPDLVHAWGSENAAALVAARLGYPSLVTMQGLMNWMLELGLLHRPYHKLVAWFERSSLRRLRHVTAESSFAVGYLRERYPHLELRQIEHAPSWGFHQLQRPSMSSSSVRRFISISTLGHPKGTDVLLQALDQVREEFEFEVLLIGGADPAVMDAYRKSVSPDLWNRLRFKNHLTSAEVAAELAASSLLIYPTRADNSPNAVKEAVVIGVPVVASRVGGIVDYVHPGQNGFLFPSEDVAACAESIRAACRHPIMGQGQVDPATWNMVRDALSPATMGRKFLEAYRAVAADA